ncbi:Alpha/Beta hydrolase protein [Syncephalis pseudoplumigaleata]|uniref:Alpha/Beta hydrolase protein n=1 Tax=Syncephalis pseudoplumigaleata TaxID=1712513 RepID=A0A4V1J237_9FUNG|nr:Alpha/Beta hydrolase protein [Syncephalis pseudoplumigaleata]|eukprot:RKP27199.1 Alpha/Beta hydrolase protein [Syncephalis pseudoplumigaleata]
MPDFNTTVQGFFALFAVIAGSGVFLAYYFQCSLIYLSRFPEGSRTAVDKPSKYNLPYEEVWLRSSDGVRLHAYLITRATPGETAEAPTLFYCQANAGNIGHRLPIAENIYRRCRCNVFMLSYRGYGLSEGTANEKGIKLDTQASGADGRAAALSFIRHHDLLKDTRIILYGQSIGGAVALDLAAHNEEQIHALILENTFLSVPKLIPHLMPFLSSVAFLCHQQWQSEETIRRLRRVPVLFLASGQDELVPPAHMSMLYDLCNTTGGSMWQEFPHGTHNDACAQPGYFEAIEQFWRQHVASKPTASLSQ